MESPVLSRNVSSRAAGALLENAVDGQASPADVIAVIANVVREQVADDLTGRARASRGIAHAMAVDQVDAGPRLRDQVVEERLDRPVDVELEEEVRRRARRPRR